MQQQQIHALLEGEQKRDFNSEALFFVAITLHFFVGGK